MGNLLAARFPPLPRRATMPLAMQGLARIAACLTMLALAACDRQADTDYVGEPIAQIGGTITSSVADVPGGLVPLISWAGHTVEVEEADVTLEFPSRFRIDIRRPPSENALNDFTEGGARPDEARVAFGLIMAMPFEVDEDDLNEDGTTPFGVAERHMIVYAESDVAAGSTGASAVGGAVSAGFHVVEVVPGEDPACGGDFDCLRPAPDDLDTRVEIRVDLFLNLDVPVWGLP
jgi:hypothetical protein